MANMWNFHHGKELEDVIKLEERALSEVKWSGLSLPLSKFVEEYTMPQMVQIVDGFYSEEDESSLSSGQIMKVHCLKSISNVCGVDQNGDNIYVPLNTPQQVRVRPANYGHVYDSVSDLTRAKPFPRFVEVIRGYYDPTGAGAKTGNDLTIEAGEILEVTRASENPLLNLINKDKNIIFKNMRGVEMSLPHDCQPGFKVLLGKGACFLAEAVNQNHMPFYGSFVDSKLHLERNNSKKLSKFGVIRFEEVHQKDLIIASCGLWSVRVVFTIPKDIDVTVRVAKGTLTRDPGYLGLCQGYNNYKKIDELVVKRYELDIHRDTREVNGYEYHIRTASEGEFVDLPSQGYQEDISNEDEDDYDDVINNREVDNENSTQCHDEETKFESQGSWVNNQSRQGSYNLPVGEKAQSQKKESVQLLGMKVLTSSREKLNRSGGGEKTNDNVIESQDTGIKQPLGQNQYLNRQEGNTIPAPETMSNRAYREVLNSFATEPETRVISPDPVLDQPQDIKPNLEDVKARPIQTHTVSSDFEIPNDLSGLDTKGVGICLNILNLRHLVKIFEENQINGSLLVSLDDEDLVDLISKRFERKKVMRFIEGWRPDQ